VEIPATSSNIPGTLVLRGATGEAKIGSMRIEASGNVGFGTTPSSSFGKSIHLFNDLNTGTVASNSYLLVESQNRNANIELSGSSSSTNSITFSDVVGAPVSSVGSEAANSNLLFRTGGTTERMRVDASGNVGIGTTTMSQRLNVEGSIHLGGTGFRYISTTSEHLAFVKKAGGPFHFYFRKTDDGTVNGTNSTEMLVIKNSGQVRFQPLASDPSGAQAGDVYYNSGDNKLKVYNGTSWVDLH
jgi:hypothetical protein